MVIDLHAHILPGADHGCRDRATAQAQLESIAANGTDAVVATPHFYPHRDNIVAFLARRTAAVERLRRCTLPPALRVFLGSEVQVCEGLDEMEELEALCIRGTKVILLEMPHTKWSTRLLATVLAIAERGLVPVLAHVDRYPVREINKLLEKGVLAQLNAEALEGFFSRRRAIRYLKGGRVVAFGSDLHGAEPDGYEAFLRVKRLDAAQEVFARTRTLLAGVENIAEALPASAEMGMMEGCL